MRRLPNFFGLRAFESAARLGSFAAAGGELHLTPSAISHQIRALERHFGLALFTRTGRRVMLTPDGAQLFARVTRTLDELEAACAELQAPPDLSLHCAPSFATEWLGPRLPRFLAGHPQIAVRVSASAEPIDLVRREEYDMSIVYGAAPTRPGLVVEPLGVERMAAMVAPSLQGADPATMVLIQSALRPVRWEDWFAMNGLLPPPRQARPSFDRAAMAIAAAAQGLGAVLESTRLAERRLAAGELVVLAGFRPIDRPLHFLCYRASSADAPHVQRFRAWLLHEITAPVASP